MFCFINIVKCITKNSKIHNNNDYYCNKEQCIRIKIKEEKELQQDNLSKIVLCNNNKEFAK
jgi:hypothetical protein